MLSIAFLALLLIAAAAGLYLTEAALNVWDSMQTRPTWFVVMFLGILVLALVLSAILFFKLLFPQSKKSKPSQVPVISENKIEKRLKKAAEEGLDIGKAQHEIDELDQRRGGGQIYIAVVGEVNMGKSSIIKAILPSADISTSNVAGTTQQITHYKWSSPAGDELILVDVPGSEQADHLHLSVVARNEALRAHMVIYVCDGDLSRTQNDELQILYSLKKPMIVALNKSDVYQGEELERIQHKLKSQLSLSDVANNNEFSIVTINCHREEEIIRIHANGYEEVISRSLPADVDQLTLAIQRIIDSHEDTLDELRDSAVFVLATSLLNEAEAIKKESEANEIVNQYTKRAIVGALATVSPGTDIIVQAYIGTSMVKAICEVYEIPVRKFDIETLLKLIQAQIGKKIPVILAIVGNGLKAFPGLGTLAGGLVHATVYALVFDTLGKTLVKTLSTRREFHPAITARIFQETLKDNLKIGTSDMIKIVLAAKETKA